MCFNCAGQLLALDPLPATLDELRRAVSRERRAKDRRIGKPDTRVFQYERRVGERRSARDEYPHIDDEMIIEVIVEAAPADGDAVDFDDITQIRELVRELRPFDLAG
jgi:hypothetical protein